MRTIILIILFAGMIFPYGLIYATATTSWTEYSSNPVYVPGKAYYPSILKEGGTYTMWSDNAAGVQMATSSDGKNWVTAGQTSGLLNPRHTVVEKVGSEYRMWYNDSGRLYGIQDIRTATSSDGLIWINDQPITQVGTTVITGTWPSWNTGSYGPCDILYNPAGSATITEPVDEASVWANKFVMYYDGTTGGDEFLGLAVSNDGINWQGYNGGANPVLDSTPSAWDSGYVGFGTVIKESDDAYHLWYSGGSDSSLNNGIGYAFSTDGINWTKDVGNPIFHKSDGVAWRNDRTYTPMVIGDQMWFTGKSTTGIYAVGYATAGVSIYVNGNTGSDTTGDGSQGNPYLTIGKGITVSTAGDTVIVEAATYTEAITISKAITVQGAGRDTTIIDATGETADIAVNITGPGGDVTFDGFTVKTKGEWYPYWTYGMNVVSATTDSTITVTNNKIEGTGNPDNYECGVYVHGTSASFVFQHNIVTEGGGNILLFEVVTGATDVSYNTLDAGSWGMGCFYMTHDNTDVTTLQKFSNNTFDLGTGQAFDEDYAVLAVSFNGAYRRPSAEYGTGEFSNIEIKSNHFFNGHAWGRAIGLSNLRAEDGTGGVISNAAIEGNWIEGLDPANDESFGIRLMGKVQDIIITNNTISGMKDGILGVVGYYGTHYPGTVTANYNNLTGNGTGGTGADWPFLATTLNAENNWWGKADGPGSVGPGSGDTVSTNVDYDPWLGKPAQSNVVYLVPEDGSVYVKPTDPYVFVDMNVANLAQPVSGLQALLKFSSTYFKAGTSEVLVTAGGGDWDELVYDVWTTGGDLDVAVGVDLELSGGTLADATTSVIKLRPTGTEGITRLIFRSDAAVDPGLVASTFLSDLLHQPVWPAKVNSTNIYIDGTLPEDVTISATPPGYTNAGTVTLTFSATDALSGIDYYQLSIDSNTYFTATSSYALDVSGMIDGTHTATVKAVDKAGNEATASTNFYLDKTKPLIAIVSAKQNGFELIGTVKNAVQGTINIQVTASDATSGLVPPPTVTVTPSSGPATAATYVNQNPTGTFNYTWIVGSTTPNGTATINASVSDVAGNTENAVAKQFNINKNKVTGTVSFATLNNNAYSVSRDVVFVATNAGGTVLATWTVNVNFTNAAGTASGTYSLDDVPTGTAKLSAKTAWQLRQRQAVALNGDGQAVSNFTLKGGDINGSNSVNILDYSIMKANWGGVGQNNVANVNGDPLGVQTLDYSLLKTSWFQVGDTQ
jgi:hypothetical protein